MPLGNTIDTNTLSVRAIKEVTYGTTPATPTLQEIRVTADSLAPNKETITSDIIRSDAMVDSIIRTLISGGGALPFEVVYGAEFETFLTGLMRNATITQAFEAGSWSVTPDTPVVGQSTITGSGTTYLTTFTSDAVGAMARFWNGTTGVAVAKIISIDSETSMVVADPNGNLTGQTGDQVDIRYIRNGTTLEGFTIEEQVTDDGTPTDYFAVATGMRVSGLSLTINAQGLLTGEWTFDGLDYVSAASAIAGETVTAAGTTKPMAASGDVYEMWEGETFNNCLTEFTINITNNPRVKAVVGQVTPKGIGFGRFTPTGNVTYFKDSNTLLDKLRNHTATSLDLFGQDEDGNVIVLTIPQVRYTDGGDTKEGADSDVFFSAGWGCERDSTMGDAPGAMLQFSIFGDAPQS